jgi:hypothetical protein
MRTLLAVAYFIGAGYLIANLELDREAVAYARAGYRALIRQAVAIVDEARAERAELAGAERAELAGGEQRIAAGGEGWRL